MQFHRDLLKQIKRQREKFCRDRARAVSERKKRVLTGEAWELRADAVSKLPFWYNRDTGTRQGVGTCCIGVCPVLLLAC